ncbi:MULTISPECIES: class I SAM-dependent methyltransferase [Actinoalloteichus]|uniref:class I SAM-dependent methyltransferase n=1 Tax=Actinoalloteichus TaxID=65496 RepID=UPI000687ED44|nr:class I SAM-dependent methyltransferase [Actinoalloteichus caeruleus]
MGRHRSVLGRAAFGEPRGLPGRLGGLLMSWLNRSVERHAVLLADPAPRDTVLVIGFGPGVGLLAAAEAAWRGHVVGVDPSRIMVRTALARCAERVRSGQMRLHLGTAAELGEADDSVDIAISVNNVHLWPDRRAGFTEVRRVLRPHGRLVLSAHRGVLGNVLDEIPDELTACGFTSVEVDIDDRGVGGSVEIIGTRAG